MREQHPMRLEKLVPGALPHDVTDQNVEAEVREMLIVKTTVVEEGARYSSREVLRVFEKDGTLVAIMDPARERDWSK